jgi:hypothetical protein
MRISEAPEVRPSADEFLHPLALIERLASLADHSGIVKIIPPKAVSESCYSGVLAKLKGSGCRIWSRSQPICLPDWSSLDAGADRFVWIQQPKTLKSFQKSANSKFKKFFPSKKIWHDEEVEVLRPVDMTQPVFCMHGYVRRHMVQGCAARKS